MANKIAGLTALGLAVLLGGCASVHYQVDPAAKVGRLQHIYVDHLLSDGHHIDDLIARELRSMGYDASAGPLTLIPMGTQAIVEYEDTWDFDFTTYLIELDLAVRDAKTGQQIGVARYFRPSVFGSNPTKVVDATLNKIFVKH